MEKTETRQCQNCKKEFTIEPEDFDFYAKIKVPPPTWCPDCRRKRRMIFRNERILYKRVCSLCGKQTISVYPQDVPFPVYCSDCWWSDRWEGVQYGREYDFSKPFFQQLKELALGVPHLALQNKSSINSEYCNFSLNNKNCYLLVSASENENCLYTFRIHKSRDSFDSYHLISGELCYEDFAVNNSARAFFCSFSKSLLDSWFCTHSVGLTSCFGCYGLKGKQYYYFNKPLSKEDFSRIINERDLGSFRGLAITKEKVDQHFLNFPRKFADITRSTNSTGNYLGNSRNCRHSFFVTESDNTKYALLCWKLTDSMDVEYSDYGTLLYEAMSIGEEGAYNDSFGVVVWGCVGTFYSQHCFNSNNLFGCIGLRHKQYCILNKQYTKESFDKLRTKIIEHMNKMPYIDKKGRVYKYGEFFPPELSPFCYNETIAQEYFPLTKKEALEQDYQWKEPEERNIKPDLKTNELPDHIKDVSDEIIGKIIQCQHAKIKEDGTLETTCNEQCTTAFKIIEPELAFYKRMNLPLPRLCPNCRHYQRLKQRNPLKLWHRKCQCAGTQSDNGIYKNTTNHPHHGPNHCPNEFETSYAPERKEIVYCEQCYLQEVI